MLITNKTQDSMKGCANEAQVQNNARGFPDIASRLRPGDMEMIALACKVHENTVRNVLVHGQQSTEKHRKVLEVATQTALARLALERELAEKAAQFATRFDVENSPEAKVRKAFERVEKKHRTAELAND